MIAYSTNAVHDFYCYNAAGQVWNGSAFVNWSDADYATYRVTATQLGTSGRFQGTAPAGTFSYELRERDAPISSSIRWAVQGPRETWTVVTDTEAALTIDRT